MRILRLCKAERICSEPDGDPWRKSCKHGSLGGKDGRTPLSGVQPHMRLWALVFTVFLAAASAQAQTPKPSSPPDAPAAALSSDENGLNLPVSLEKIKEGLEQTPAISFRTLDERPTFRVMIRERQKIEELLATLNYKTTPAPAGGLYGYEMQRQQFPSVDNPLRQPYAAFNQPELLTILVENLVGHYLAGKAMSAITSAERAHAEAAARNEVRQAVSEYCNAQPNAGAGVLICETPIR